MKWIAKKCRSLSKMSPCEKSNTSSNSDLSDYPLLPLTPPRICFIPPGKKSEIHSEQRNEQRVIQILFVSYKVHFRMWFFYRNLSKKFQNRKISSSLCIIFKRFSHSLYLMNIKCSLVFKTIKWNGYLLDILRFPWYFMAKQNLWNIP